MLMLNFYFQGKDYFTHTANRHDLYLTIYIYSYHYSLILRLYMTTTTVCAVKLSEVI